MQDTVEWLLGPSIKPSPSTDPAALMPHTEHSHCNTVLFKHHPLETSGYCGEDLFIFAKR